MRRIVWGWARLFLGLAQIALVGLSVGALISVGLKPFTLTFVIGATILTVVSWLFYKGQDTPKT